MADTMLPPLSPLTQCINTPVLTFYVLGVCELEIPLNKPETLELIENGLLPLNQRFSSIIITDKNGVQRWEKVQCMTEDHVVVATCPSGLRSKEYDIKLEDYISDIYMEQLPATRPPWEVHLFTHPTSNAATTILFKFHHALGDGYSIMGALSSLFKRTDDPSLPIRFPTASSRLVTSKFSKISNFVSRWMNTCTDFTRSISSAFIQDDDTVIRSKTPGLEFTPVNVRSVTLSLDQVRQIKNATRATVNDVTTGLLAFALQLYMKRKGQASGKTCSTALILINLRMYRGFKTVEDMLKENIWGNHFGFLNVSLPAFGDVDNVNPLDYISKSRNELRRRINSLSCYFSSKFLNILARVGRVEAAAKHIHSSMRNTSTTISSMCGPIDKVAVAGRPLKSFYFTVSGAPQSLTFTIVSYNGKLRVVVTSERGYIDSHLLLSCLKDAFIRMYTAAVGEHPMKIE